MAGTTPNLLSFLAFAPAAGLAVAAGAVGIGTPAGIGCAIGALGWTVLDLLAIDPKIRKGGHGAEDVGTAFMRRALRAGSIADVARDLELALRQGFGPDGPPSAVLLAPGGADGEINVLPLAGVRPKLPSGPEGLTPALDWLTMIGDPLERDGVVQMQALPVEEGGGDGAAAVVALMDACGADVVLPLRHRGLLLGVLLIGRPADRRTDPQVFKLCRALRAYATAAVARTFLDAEVGQRGKLTQKIDLATAMQEAMMPAEKPVRRPGFELRGVFRPVEECGGDLWMWRELGGGKVLLLTADATGHGAAPALLAAVAKGTVDALCQQWGTEVDPGQLLSQLGRVVFRAGKRRYLMTAFAVVVDIEAQTIHYANAGQNFPLIVRAPKEDGAAPTVEPIVARGDTLGTAPRVRYDTQSRSLPIGDRLLLYTDGVVDAGTPYKEPFGDKRLRNTLIGMARERATKVPELLLAELEKHTGGQPMGDDVTMLMFELTEPST